MMQTTAQELASDITKTTNYVVHHRGECVGQAIWTIEKSFKLVEEAAATIEDVQADALLLLETTHGRIITIGGVDFELDGIVPILIRLAQERIVVKIDDRNNPFSLEELTTLEDVLHRLPSQ